MKKSDIEVARELKRRVSQVTTLLDFRVFGSRARGDADDFSDMDVFIEIDALDDAVERKIRDAVWEVGFEHGLYISPLLCTRYEIEETPLRSSPIVKNISSEGVKV